MNPHEPLPQLHHPIARSCMDCQKLFETCWFRQWRCEQCSLARLVACTAYAEHQSASEALQARRLAAQVQREQRAADRLFALKLTWLMIGAGLVLLLWSCQ